MAPAPQRGRPGFAKIYHLRQNRRIGAAHGGPAFPTQRRAPRCSVPGLAGVSLCSTPNRMWRCALPKQGPAPLDGRGRRCRAEIEARTRRRRNGEAGPIGNRNSTVALLDIGRCNLNPATEEDVDRSGSPGARKSHRGSNKRPLEGPPMKRQIRGCGGVDGRMAR